MEWTHVNDVTWKLTGGDQVISAGGYGLGMKGGYGASRAVAWVINVGWPAHRGAWYVRIGEKSAGPFSITKAKRAAEAILAGDPEVQGFTGALDLNGLAAKFLDEAARATAFPRLEMPGMAPEATEAVLSPESPQNPLRHSMSNPEPGNPLPAAEGV